MIAQNAAVSDFDKLAKLVKEAAKVREASYVTKPMDLGSDSLITTYGEYELSIDDACEKVAKETGLSEQHARLASFMLFSFWNDALDWADTQLHPVEMKFVEACYAVANELYMQDTDLGTKSQQELSDQFAASAKEIRKGLYDFGEATAV